MHIWKPACTFTYRRRSKRRGRDREGGSKREGGGGEGLILETRLRGYISYQAKILCDYFRYINNINVYECNLRVRGEKLEVPVNYMYVISTFIF